MATSIDRARRAIERARPARDSEGRSLVSRPVRDGDIVAVYAAPREGRELEPQAALGSGSVTADALGKRGSLIDADALTDAVDALPAGSYDITVRLRTAPGSSPGAADQRRTEVVTVVLRDSDEPGERGPLITRAIQDVARNVVKEDSSRQVRIVGAVLAPEGELGEAPSVEPLPQPTREGEAAQRRSVAAQQGWRTRRRNERLAQEEAERAARADRARRGWETRRKNERAAARAAAKRAAARKAAKRKRRR